jgi:hypothetical protein
MTGSKTWRGLGKFGSSPTLSSQPELRSCVDTEERIGTP